MNDMTLAESLYWTIADANPGEHGEDFENEVAMILDLGYNAAKAIALIAERSSYVAGSNKEFEEKLMWLLG